MVLFYSSWPMFADQEAVVIYINWLTDEILSTCHTKFTETSA